MSNIIDFQKFKKEKEENNKLESTYLKFLDHINSFVGIPKSIDKCVETIYMCTRYLEGTINCFSVLTMFTPINTKELDEIKNMTINWLEGIIENIKNL